MIRARPHDLCDERGATSVCAVFFAFFLFACAFAVHATYEAIVYRENLQDAADAAAFIGAVIHAKSMNLIVLIHVIMAVLLAILVGLRLVETLCIVATGICSALSVPTYGASLAYVPTLAELTNNVHDGVEQVKENVNRLLPLLHSAANLVSTAMPLLANAKVIDVASASYDVWGLAIPNQTSLPLEDGSFGQLCRKAGDYAGGVVSIPFKIIPPVSAGIDKAVEAITAAGPEWFCGGGDRGKPEMERNSKAGWVSLPKTRSQDECETSLSGDDAHHDACDRASVEQLAATPARDGSERAGEPLCPTHCAGSNDRRCPPKSFSDCSDLQLQSVDQQWSSGNVESGADSPYTERTTDARSACAPDSEHAKKLRAFSWVERTITRHYAYSKEQAAWIEDEGQRVESATRLLQREDDDANKPCGPDGLYATLFEQDGTKPLCTGNFHCLSMYAGTYGSAGQCPRERPLHVENAVLIETETEVVNLLGCGYREKAPDAVVPDVDVASETGGGNDKVPLALRADALLGGDSFQVRGIVLAKEGLASTGLAVARRVLGQAKRGGVGDELLGFVARLGAAQAEHYFDWSKMNGDAIKQQKSADARVAWMWNMGWTARLRPLRFSSGDDSGPDDDDGEEALGGQLGAKSSELQGKLCGEIKQCDKMMRAFDVLGGDS